MADNVTSSFPKMGEEGIPHSFVNLSARPSPYTMPQPRHRAGTVSDVTPGTGTKRNKGATLIHNAQGPSVCKFAVLYEQNAAVATEGQRNIRLMPRYTGDGGFWAKRAEGGKI